MPCPEPPGTRRQTERRHRSNQQSLSYLTWLVPELASGHCPAYSVVGTTFRLGIYCCTGYRETIWGSNLMPHIDHRSDSPGQPRSERTIESVFVACVELLIVTVFGIALLTGIAGIALPPLGGGTVFWAIHTTAILAAGTLVFHAALAGLRKQELVTSAYHQMVAEAYLGGIVIVLGVSGTMLWVAAAGIRSTDDPTNARISTVNGRTYAISLQRDWQQIASGEWKWVQEADGYMHPSLGGEASPAGLAVLGAVLGHALVLLLIGCYASYSCTPLGHRARLFLHPTALLCTNVIVSGIVPWTVAENFARCQSWGLQAGISIPALILACSYDKLLVWFVGWTRKTKHRSRSIKFIRPFCGIIVVLCHFLPMVVGPRTPQSAKYLGWVIFALGAIAGVYDYWQDTEELQDVPLAGPDNVRMSALGASRESSPVQALQWNATQGGTENNLRQRNVAASSPPAQTQLAQTPIEKLFTIESGLKRA